MTERPFNSVNDRRESSRVSGVGKGVEESGSFFGGEIQLARRAICDISGNNTGDFFTEWLDGDYIRPKSVFSSIAIVDRALAGRPTWLPFHICTLKGTSGLLVVQL